MIDDHAIRTVRQTVDTEKPLRVGLDGLNSFVPAVQFDDCSSNRRLRYCIDDTSRYRAALSHCRYSRECKHNPADIANSNCSSDHANSGFNRLSLRDGAAEVEHVS